MVGGYNFRLMKKDCFRNCYFCKNFYNEKFGLSYCVGCGRCIYFCFVGISFVRNLRIIFGFEEKFCLSEIIEEILKRGFVYVFYIRGDGL